MISYHAISNALFHYKKLGYEHIEVPWLVPEQVIQITAKEGTNYYPNAYRDGFLVGSAEQSFLYLIYKSKLKPGKYCAVTPCFRDDKEDETHQKYFMKLELIHYLGMASDETEYINELEIMVNDALSFFKTELPVYWKKTQDDRSLISYDIEYQGIELGSYGIRQHNDSVFGVRKLPGEMWIYGTGVAEPRFSSQIKRHYMENRYEDNFKI